MRKKKQREWEGYYFVEPGRRKRSLADRLLPVWNVFALLAIAASLFVLAAIVIPTGTRPRLGRGNLGACLEGEELTLSWPEPSNADAVRLYIFDPEKMDYVLQGEYQKNETVLENVRQNEEIMVQLQAVKHTTDWTGQSKERTSRIKSVTIRPVKLEPPAVRGDLDAKNRTVTIQWEAGSRNLYEVCQKKENDSWESVIQTGKDSAVLQFGDELTLPAEGTSASLAVRTMRREDGCAYYSPLSEPLLISGEYLSGTQLALSYEKTGDHQYRISWEDTLGDTFEVRQWSAQENGWVTVAVLDWDAAHHYDTGVLPSNEEVRFQVIAYREGVQYDEEDFSAEAMELTFQTDLSPLYCTIWPIMDVTMYDSAQNGQPMTAVPGGEALCVLAEKDGSFYVRYDGQYGYINSDYCMINLPEYLGDLCAYDNKNSYSSIFRAHGYGLPGITGEVVQGFEHAKLGENEYLVPYLYPCTALLRKAAEKVQEDGYRLKIYEAFRPNEATRYLFDTVQGYLDETVTGQPVGMAAGQAPDSSAAGQAGGAGSPTYREVMTNSQYSLSYFLAETISSHNRGIAVDLTLEETESGREVKMQTDMHDLSWHAALTENNEAADLLTEYMTGVGFTGLVSEWWHFQDDATKNRLKLDTYLTQGVSVEGWKKDATGWRYRLEDGSYYRGTTAEVEGVSRTFDENGYCAEIEEPQAGG